MLKVIDDNTGGMKMKLKNHRSLDQQASVKFTC